MAGFRGCNGGGDHAVERACKSTAYPYQFGIGIVGYHGSGSGWSPALDASITALVPPPLADRDVVTIRHIDGAGDAADRQDERDHRRRQVSGGSPVAAGDVLLVADCGAAAIFQATLRSRAADSIAHEAGAATPGNSTKDLGHVFGSRRVGLSSRDPHLLRRASAAQAGNELTVVLQRAQLRRPAAARGDGRRRRGRSSTSSAKTPTAIKAANRYLGAGTVAQLEQRGQRQGATAARHRARQHGDLAAALYLRRRRLRRPPIIALRSVAHVDDHAAQPGALTCCARRTDLSIAAKRGMSLFPALMFLLVLAVLGVATMSSTVHGRTDGRQHQGQNLAFQAAEVGSARRGEPTSRANVTAGTLFTSGCTNGLCTPPSTWPTPTSTDISKLIDWASNDHDAHLRRAHEHRSAAAGRRAARLRHRAAFRPARRHPAAASVSVSRRRPPAAPPIASPCSPPARAPKPASSCSQPTS